jgi:hypothetical protein
MMNKLTRWVFLGTNREKEFNFEMFSGGDWCDFEEVKELLANQEKKTKILLDALERITNLDHVRRLPGCWCHVEVALEALKEYKKE